MPKKTWENAVPPASSIVAMTFLFTTGVVARYMPNRKWLSFEPHGGSLPSNERLAGRVAGQIDGIFFTGRAVRRDSGLIDYLFNSVHDFAAPLVNWTD